MKGDNVVVISGRDKGKKGVVEKVYNGKVLIEGINICNKAVKPNEKFENGGVVGFSKPINISKLSLLDSLGNKTKVGFAFDEKGKKIRKFKKTGVEI